MKHDNVIEIRNNTQTVNPPMLYVYGKTLRSLEREMGGNPEHLFDTHGTPVLDLEYYEITSAGIRRL